MQPKIYSPIEFDIQIPGIRHTQADNGINIYKLISESQTAVQIEWTFEAGLWQEDLPGTAQTAGRLLRNGTRLHSEFEINEQLEYLGASLRVAVNNDYTHIVLMTLDKHLPVLLPIVREIITQADYPEEELKIFITNALQALDVNLMKNEFVANRLIEEQLFGIHHPYGRYLEKSDYRSISRDSVRDFHRQYYRYDNCTIFIAGGLSPAHEQLLLETFGSDRWNETGIIPHEKAFAVRPHEEKSIHRILDESSVQSAVRMACHTIHRDNKDYLSLQFLNIIFGGYFGSRLMANIREDKGYTYGIYSYLASHRHNSFLIISSEVDSRFTSEVLHEIRYEMQQLVSTAVPDEELWISKNYVIGSLIADMDGVFSLIQMWKSLILQGQNEGHFYERIETFKKLDAGDLRGIAEKYLQPGSFYTTLVT